jgi:hypothetical protein
MGVNFSFINLGLNFRKVDCLPIGNKKPFTQQPMSKNETKKKVVVTTTKKAAPAASKTRSSSGAAARRNELIFGKKNYMMILAGIGIIALGLVLMSGGAMPSTDVWDETIIYSKRRTLVAPIVIIAGLVVVIFAIFKSPTVDNTDTTV